MIFTRLSFAVYLRCRDEDCGSSARSSTHERARSSNPLIANRALRDLRRHYPKSEYYLAVEATS